MPRLRCHPVAVSLQRFTGLKTRLRPGTLLLAVISYVPLLLTHRGKLGADTKVYLYLDPAKLLRNAATVWDPGVGLGTVTHQNIGYLFPMGPYYWLMDAVGFPDWVAQRIWMGSVIFLAGLGVQYLLKTLRWEGAGATVAAVIYALSPYVLHYIYKHSVILLPFTALPWLVAFTAQSLRTRGWKYPACFAFAALCSGGINATSLLLVMLGPGLWVLHAVFVERELRLRQSLAPLLRIGLLTVVTSLWWIAGLAIQGSYGINVLAFTETYKTVSDAATAAEVHRGFGYWFFYGVDPLGPWFKAATTYTQSMPALVLSFVLPAGCLLAGLLTRFRYRVFVVALGVVGLVVSVGAHPLDSPTPYGLLFRAFTETKSGLAMRSTPRAIPLLALSCALMAGAGIAVLAQWRPHLRRVFAAGAILCAMANLSPMFTGNLIDPFLERPEDVPQYWHDAGDALSAGDRETRALEVPGIDFADYRWGSTVDPITPGLTDRDFAARELVPYGSPASADLMNAIDTPLQNAAFVPSAWEPLMQMMSVGSVVLRSDIAYERNRAPRPRRAFAWLQAAFDGVTPAQFGSDAPNIPPAQTPLIDEVELAIPAQDPDPHSVVIYPVSSPRPMISTAPAKGSIIVSGDGAGLVRLAEAGLLDPDRLVRYSGSMTAAELQANLDQDGLFVVTDTNRKAGRRWGTTKNNEGATEQVNEVAPKDLSDNRLNLFGPATESPEPDTQSVAEHRDGVAATASAYGNVLSFTPGDRAVLAVDDQPDTAWRVGAFGDVRGQWIELRATDRPISPRWMSIRQAEGGNRHITTVALSFDGGEPQVVSLNEESRGEGGGDQAGSGQRIPLSAGSFRTLRITILASTGDGLASYQGQSGVGFSTLALDGVAPTVEVIRTPVDLTVAVGSKLADQRFAVVLSRLTAPHETGAVDPERQILRTLQLPTALKATLRGSLTLDPEAPDPLIDGLLGIGGSSFSASSGLRDDAYWRASKVADGSEEVGWQSSLWPGSSPERPEWIEISAPASRTLVVSGFTVMTDGQHSLPTKIHFEVDGVAQAPIQLDISEALRRSNTERQERDSQSLVAAERGGTTAIVIAPQTLTGTTVRLVIDEFHAVEAPDWLTGRPVTLPLGITEIASPTLALERTVVPPSADACQAIVEIGAKQVPIRPSLPASTDTVERGGRIEFETCSAEPMTLPAGDVKIGSPLTAGLLASQLVFESAAAPTTRDPATHDPATQAPTESPELQVSRLGRVSYEMSTTSDAEQPYWLLLGQSHNAGWSLHADGVDLGPSSLVNGYANGWFIDPERVGPRPKLTLEWTPQRPVWVALIASLLGVLCCLWLMRRPAEALRRGITREVVPFGIGLRDSFGAPAELRLALLTATAAALGGGIAAGWWAAAPVGALTFAALRTRWGWPILRAVFLAVIAVASAYVIAKQWRAEYRVDFDWPQHFEPAHNLFLLAYALLAAESVVEAVRGGWRRVALAAEES